MWRPCVRFSIHIRPYLQCEPGEVAASDRSLPGRPGPIPQIHATHYPAQQQRLMYERCYQLTLRRGYFHRSPDGVLRAPSAARRLLKKPYMSSPYVKSQGVSHRRARFIRGGSWQCPLNYRQSFFMPTVPVLAGGCSFSVSILL